MHGCASGLASAALGGKFSTPGKAIVNFVLAVAGSVGSYANCWSAITKNFSVLPDLAVRSALMDGALSLGGALATAYGKNVGYDGYTNLVNIMPELGSVPTKPQYASPQAIAGGRHRVD